jgi:ABC-type multidrug transport system fused ATPase/permease subunit
MSGFGLRIINTLKGRLFAHILSLDLSFFCRHQVGWLLSRVESDCEQLKNFCSQTTIRMFMDGLIFVGVLLAIFISEPVIAPYITILMSVLFVMVFVFLGRMRRAYDLVRSRYAELTSFVSEYIQGISVIRLYNRENEVRRHLRVIGNQRYDAELRASVYEYGFWSFFNFLTETFLVLIILYFSIPRIMRGEMSIGKLVMLIEFSRQMTWPLLHFMENFNNVQRAFVAADRVFSILDEKSCLGETGLKYTGFPEQIEFRDVSFHYKPENPVLHNLNFTIKRGEKIALVGPSGGGKSTIASLLCRFYDPCSGQILIDGQDLATIDPADWRKSIGLVLQDIYLFPGTILDNLRVLDKEVPAEQVHKAAETLGAAPFIVRQKDGYDTELSERGGNLSLGERQLLSFTRALTFGPELLILDEATASIDPYTELLLQRALEKLLQGRTAVIVAHRLSTIQNVDRILVIENGEIAEQGTHTELIAQNGLYSRLYNLQSEKEKIA